MTDESSDAPGIPLTPAVFEELVLEHFTGKTIKRSDLAIKVEEIHLGAGGKPGNQPAQQQAKKALGNLAKVGAAKKAFFAHWTIVGPGAETEDVDAAEILFDIEEPDVEEVLEIETELGVGDHVVYAYYYPAYKELAGFRGEAHWPVKVGLSKKSLEARIAEQTSLTGIPEAPMVGLAIWTDDASRIEKGLHLMLDQRGRRCEEAGGNEWFRTSPEEVATLYKLLVGESEPLPSTAGDEGQASLMHPTGLSEPNEDPAETTSGADGR